MASHIERRDYLVERLIDGAKALSELFGRVSKNESLNPCDVESELIEKYKLTLAQEGFLENAVNELDAAKGKIEELKKKFCYDPKKGEFEDKEGLYRFIFGKEAPKGSFYTKVFSYAIGFYVPQKYVGRSNFGVAYACLNDSNSTLDEEKSAKRLCFKVGNFMYSRRKRDFLEIFRILNAVEKHELKHVDDGITEFLFEDPSVFNEFSADMYSFGVSKRSLGDDLKDLKANLSLNKRDYLKLKKMKAPQVILRMREEKIKEKEAILRDADKIFQLCKNINIPKYYKYGLNKQVLSFVVSTTPSKKLYKRLKLVEDYLQRKK